MLTTPTQGIPYPSGNDYGQGARHLQDMAEFLEAKVNIVDAGWALRRSPPTWIVRTTSTQSSVNTAAAVTWQSIDYDNTGLGPINSGSAFRGYLAKGGPTELWYVGAWVQLSQGATVASFRRARLSLITADPVTAASSTQSLDVTGYESQSSGEQIVVDGVVRVTSDTVMELKITAYLDTINLSAPSMMWATRIAQD